MEVLQFIFTQILGQSYILLAIVVFIGYMALKQPFSKAFSGSIKTAVGVLVMSIGSGQLIANFNVVLTALNTRFGIKGVLLDTYSTMNAANDKLGKFATWSVYVMLGAFVVNLILVALRKYTKVKAVFLTGNVMIVQTAIATYIVYRFLNTGMFATIAIASIITGLYWGISSTALIPATKAISGADITIGHQQQLGSWLAYKLGGLVGKPEEDVEKIKMPKWLSIFQDNIMSSAVVLVFFTTILLFAVGQETVAKQAGTTNWIIFILTYGLKLAASLFVLLTGVRLFVGELMMSFKGISEKILPGAVIAVDCAAIFGFSPKAVLLGFLSGSLGQIVAIIGLIVFKSPIMIVPGFIPMFFDNATIGIFANKKGGWRAAILFPFLSGIIQVTGVIFAVQMMNINFWQGSFDWSTVWVAIIAILKAVGSLLGIAPV